MAVFTTRALLQLGAAIAALATTPAFAQDAQTTGTPQTPATEAQASVPADASGGDIIVTARRREETLLNVPIAVTAFTADRLEKSGALDLTDIQNTTPNTTLKDARGTNSTLAAFIRGVGQQDPVPGFESGVGIYLDDVYLNRPQAAVLDVYDVDRIEVLRGPQGTLYGRNTIGGAVKYVTKKLPDDLSVNLKGTYGSYNELDGVVSVSSPVVDGIKVGIAGARLSHDGFGRNLNLGIDNYNKDLWAVRGTIEAQTPDGRLFARLTGDYTDDTSNARNGHRMIPGIVSGTPVLANVYDTQAGLANPKEDVRAGGGSLSITAQLSDTLTLRNIMAYREDRSFTPIDFDALPAVDVDVPAVYRNSQISEEAQLLYKSDKLNGLIGYYYLGAKASTEFDVLLNTTLAGLDAYTAGTVRTSTSSVYGDFTYDFTRQLSLSVGGRYTWDARDSTVFKANYLGPGNGATPAFGGSAVNPLGGAPLTNFNGHALFKRFTPRVSLNFQVTPEHLIYASYSEGFKGGGFDPRGSGTSAPISNAAAGRTYNDIYNFLLFKPETVRSYEIGWKAALFDRRLTFALDGFYANYDNVQIPGSIGTTVNGVQTFIGLTTNAARAHFKGVEFESNWAMLRDFAGVGSSLNASTSFGYIDAKYDQYLAANGNYAGAPATDISNVAVFQNTPKYTVSGTLAGTLPISGGAINASGTISYRSLTHQFTTASVYLDQPGYTLVDANLSYSFGAGRRYSIGVHGKNLTNEHYRTGGYQYLYANAAGKFTTATGVLLPPGQYVSSLGKEGIATVFYGNPRQVLGTFTARF